MRLLPIMTTVTLALVSSMALAKGPSDSIITKIVSQGVPADAVERLAKFMDENDGRSFVQDTYACEGKDPDSVKPCEEEKRTNSNQTVTVGNPSNVVIIDFALPSTARRFYLINLKSGEVQKYFTSHGVNTGDNYAYRFSNTKDSRQTSLGIYYTKGTYNGKYGNTLRMYGLQKSNDQAYNRDIVLHGAWYVSEDMIKKINPNTKQPYGRIGVSWGCPAVSEFIAKKVIPMLDEGSLVMHYHKDLQDLAQSGKEVRGGYPKHAPIPFDPPMRTSVPTVFEESPVTPPTTGEVVQTETAP